MGLQLQIWDGLKTDVDKGSGLEQTTIGMSTWGTEHTISPPTPTAPLAPSFGLVDMEVVRLG
jgi:hypothetical protein